MFIPDTPHDSMNEAQKYFSVQKQWVMVLIKCHKVFDGVHEVPYIEYVVQPGAWNHLKIDCCQCCKIRSKFTFNTP